MRAMLTNKLLLVLHPSFWKKEKKIKLDQFLAKLKSRRIEYNIFDGRNIVNDVTFDLYDQGCRSFINVDSSIQITVHYYKKHFKELTITNIQKQLYERDSMLNLIQNAPRPINLEKEQK